MRSLDFFLNKEIKELNKNNIRLRFVGRQAPIPAQLLKKIKEAELITKDNSGITMVLALNYGAN